MKSTANSTVDLAILRFEIARSLARSLSGFVRRPSTRAALGRNTVGARLRGRLTLRGSDHAAIRHFRTLLPPDHDRAGNSDG